MAPGKGKGLYGGGMSGVLGVGGMRQQYQIDGSRYAGSVG